MNSSDASGAKSAERVEGPSSPAMTAANDGPGKVSTGKRPKSEGSGKRVRKTRRAVQRRPRNKKRNKKIKRKAKREAPLVDKLGRPFPPRPEDIKKLAGAGDRIEDRAGRPYAIKNVAHAISTLEGLGAIMATSKECAAVLKVTEPTLFAFFKRVPEAHDAWVGGKEQGKASLRRSQFKLAERNATMGVFLGMNYLDQKDRRAFSGDPENPIKHQHSGTVTAKVQNDYSNLSLDDLVRLHAEGVAGKKGSD